MKIKVLINNEKKEFEIKANDLLLDVLRRNGYYGVKEGCREGECGACTVLIDGIPVTSCMYPAVRADGKSITTIEGISENEKLNILQETFLDEGAVQCGFCTPGMILSSMALLEKNPSPTEEDIKLFLDGNLCRCTGYVKIIEAIKKSAKKLNTKRRKK